jgi:hypothetical protein
MAVAQQRGMPWAGGRVGPAPSGRGVQIFTAKGLAAPGLLGTTPLPQIGTLIPGTPYVYIRPRLSNDPLNPSVQSPFQPYRFPGGPITRTPATVSAMIKYTNSEYSYYRQNRRSQSIGMAAAGSVGVTMDVPFQSEVPYFSHAVQ